MNDARLRPTLAACLALGIGALTFSGGAAADVLLDTTFNPNGAFPGISPVNFGGLQDAAREVAVQADEKVVAVGLSQQRTTGGADFTTAVAVRFNADGSLDTTFDGNGTAAFLVFGPPEDGGGSDATSVVIQPDQKIVITGIWTVDGTPLQVFVLRLNTDGSLDETFGDLGVVLLDLPGLPDAAAQDLALQSDGSIIVVGNTLEGTDPLEGFVLRLTATGAVDSTFAGGGVVRFSNPTGANAALSLNTVAVLPDDSIITGGGGDDSVVGGSEGGDLVVIKLTAGGAPDSTFDADGIATYNVSNTGGGTPVNSADDINALTTYADGRILLAGSTRPDPAVDNTNILLARIDATGVLDATFGTGGFATLPDNQASEAATDVVIRTSGNIILSGVGTKPAELSPEGAVLSIVPGTFPPELISGLALAPSGKVAGAGSEKIAAGATDVEFVGILLADVPDTVPEQFSFIDQPAVDVSSTVQSEPVTIEGINVAVPISVSGGVYSIGCTTSYTSDPGTIFNGQTVCVLQDSAADVGVSTDTTLTVGGVSDVFTSTTAIPAVSPFVTQTGVRLLDSVTSNAYTVSGLTGPAEISVQNGQYSIGCTGTYTATTGTVANGGTVENGDTVCLFHRTPATLLTDTVTTLTIGTGPTATSYTFTSTTTATKSPGTSAMDALSLLLLGPLLWRRRGRVQAAG